MKKPSDNLYRLIQAMSPAEKRYFKIHFASDQNRLTELFDFINHLPEYDEEKVKAAFSPGFNKNLKVHKVQLQELLLKSLTAFKSKKTIRSRIRIGLEEVDILMEKRLHALAYDKLMKVKKLALKYEEHSYLIEISYQEIILLYIQIEKVGMSKLPVFGEIQEHIRILQKQFDLILLGNQLNDKRRSTRPEQLTPAETRELQDLLDSYPLQEDPETLNFHSHILYNTSKSFIYSLLQEKEEEVYYRRRNLELFTQYPHFQKTMAFNYLGVLRNYITGCLINRAYSDVMNAVARAEAFAEKLAHMKPHLIFFLQAEVEALFEQGRFEDIRDTAEPKVLQHINRYAIGEQRITMFTFLHLAVTHQLLGDHQQVQIYLQRMYSAEKDLVEYFYESIVTLECINHFEAGEDFLVERSLQSLLRQKKKLESTSLFFQELIQLFRSYLRQPFERPALARAFLEKERPTSDFFGTCFDFFKMNCWLEAKAGGISFREAVDLHLA